MSAVAHESNLLGIGEVVKLLASEFPDSDVSISKIRFLEAEGLVVPARTPTGYRKFSPTDVDRIRYTLRMQKDHFLPLRVIREQLDTLRASGQSIDLRDDQPATAQANAQSQQPASPAPQTPVAPMGVHELVERSGLTIKDVLELEKSGLIRRSPGSDTFGSEALQIAVEVAKLSRLGMSIKLLRPVVNAANQQAELITAVCAPHRSSAKSADELTALRKQQAELVNANLRLQLMLMRARLTDQA